jgi:hypothetical protein
MTKPILLLAEGAAQYKNFPDEHLPYALSAWLKIMKRTNGLENERRTNDLQDHV